jgi:hypothetical protein
MLWLEQAKNRYFASRSWIYSVGDRYSKQCRFAKVKEILFGPAIAIPSSQSAAAIFPARQVVGAISSCSA